MDWNTTQKKDKDSLKKLIESRYGVKSNFNSSWWVRATINGKTYDWNLDNSWNPVRNEVSYLKLWNNNKSIAQQKATPLKISDTLLTNTKNKNDTTWAWSTIQPTTQLNVKTLQQMQNNPKEAQAIANNSFGTWAGNTTQPSSWFNLVPQAYASTWNSWKSKTERQNEKWLKKKEDEAFENIQQFFYDTDWTNKNDMKKLREQATEMMENWVSYTDINAWITDNWYRHQNWAQKWADSVAWLANWLWNKITWKSDEDDWLLASAGKFIVNIPWSALKTGWSAVEAVSHPIDTWKWLMELADTWFDYLNYWLTWDPLMDKSKAIWTAIKDELTDKSTYVENPFDVLATISWAWNALKWTKIANLGKAGLNATKNVTNNVTKNVAKWADNFLDKSKVTKVLKDTAKKATNKVSNDYVKPLVDKYAKPMAKNTINYSMNPERYPKDIIKDKVVEPIFWKNVDEVNKDRVNVAWEILNDKYIDNASDTKRSSESFNYFGNEKKYVKNETPKENKEVKELENVLRDIKIDKNTTYDDLIKKLDEKQTDILNEQIRIADNTPKYKLSDFDYKKPNWEMSNRFEDIIEDLQNHLNDIDQTPEVYDMYKVLEWFKNWDKISEQQLLEIKRVYNGTFKNKYMKYDEVDKVWELRNPTSKVWKNFENNQKFIDNVLEEKNLNNDNKTIKDLDVDIKNIKTYQEKFKKMREKVRSEALNKSKFSIVEVIQTAEQMIKYVAKLTPFFRWIWLNDKKITATKMQSNLYKNIKKLYKLEKQYNNDWKKFAWIRNELNKIMDEISPYFDNKVMNITGNVLKKTWKALLDKKTLWTPNKMMEWIEDREFENKYMK